MCSVSARAAIWQFPVEGLTATPIEVKRVTPSTRSRSGRSRGRPYTQSVASGFLERLETGRPIVADGGMGALLSAAVPRLRCPEEACLRAPDAVVSLHVEFINAGAELIETNTF